ncbi:stage II sporulation protein Q [Paenibacillus forsythiae]|uniref:Stage II sporulation protein Q n=1 Tax=Paenibacillus forsythiae TaxID=365616 RepID=A0ABU3HC54_9BACL|nr:M23 family metallopeptidase [Paenibacillus forsythiae]MDT3428041.1 stage II sporulation protein Q [Paenibacillus forsythiae]
MNEQNQNKPSTEESLKTKQGETGSQPSSWNRLFSKRWVFPAVYTAAAAIILTLVWVYQDAGQKPLSTDTAAVVSKDVGASGDKAGAANAGEEPNALEVAASAESLAWPVANPGEVEVVKPYYDENGTEQNHIEAIVQSGDTFTPNTGIDLAREDNKAFDVKAAISGEVTRVEDVATLGTVVEVTQGNLKTVYQSLGEAKVKQGDQVKQGDTLAAAGRNEIEKDLGNHLHFEVYQDGKVVNPSELLPQKSQQ